MNITKNYKFVRWVFLLFGLMSINAKETVSSPVIDQKKMLQRHNFYRDEVGVPHLKWSKELTDYAQSWANHLALSCDLIHSDTKYGENIYWTSGTASVDQVVDRWGAEKQYYNHKNRTYKRGTGRKTGHYTQVIWKTTTHVGGAMQKCKHGGEIWVCSYDPPGNYIGRKSY